MAAANRPLFSLADALAGLSIAGLLLPEAVAYSSIANLPAQAGVIALFAGLIGYGLFGTSRFAIVSATSSSAAVMAAATASIGGGDLTHRVALAAGLILLTGVFFIAASLARIGSVSEFVSKPVLRGFAFGLALTISCKQLAKIAGIHASHPDLVRFMWELLAQVPHWNPIGVSLGMGALLLLFALAKFPRVPGGLLTIVVGIILAYTLNLQQYGVQLVGDMHLQIEAPTLPGLPRNEWMRLAELAFALLLILYAESYSSIRTYALKHGDATAANRDLFALGVGNALSGLLHGLPVGAGYSATSANEASGAQSKLAAWCAAATVCLMLWLALPAIEWIPEPVLAAIVIHAVSHSLKLENLRPYLVWRSDRLVLLVAIAGVILLGVLHGLLAAIAMSIGLMLRRIATVQVSELGRLGHTHDFVSLDTHRDAHAVDGVVIFRPETPLFFANVERIITDIRNRLAQPGRDVRTVVLSLEESYDLDSSSLQALADLCKLISQQQKLCIFARLKDPVQAILDEAVQLGWMPQYTYGISVDDAVAMATPAPSSAG